MQEAETEACKECHIYSECILQKDSTNYVLQEQNDSIEKILENLISLEKEFAPIDKTQRYLLEDAARSQEVGALGKYECEIKNLDTIEKLNSSLNSFPCEEDAQNEDLEPDQSPNLSLDEAVQPEFLENLSFMDGNNISGKICFYLKSDTSKIILIKETHNRRA
jgi:hypothetical protein